MVSLVENERKVVINIYFEISGSFLFFCKYFLDFKVVTKLFRETPIWVKKAKHC
jgi:hypothetical protein